MHVSWRFLPRPLFVLWAAGLVTLTGLAHADDPGPPTTTNPPPSGATPSLFDFFTARKPFEFWLTCVILAAGLIFAWLMVWLIDRLGKRGISTDGDAPTKAMIVIFVIIAAMVLISAGYSDQQVAPAFALFGTIIGYMLGRTERAQIVTAPESRPNGPNGSGGPSPSAQGKEPDTDGGETPPPQAGRPAVPSADVTAALPSSRPDAPDNNRRQQK